MPLEFELRPLGHQMEVVLRFQAAFFVVMLLSAAALWLFLDLPVVAAVAVGLGAVSLLWSVGTFLLVWPRSVIVSDDGLSVRARVHTSQIAWSRVADIRQTTIGELVRGREAGLWLMNVDTSRTVVEITFRDAPGKRLALEPLDREGFVSAASAYVEPLVS